VTETDVAELLSRIDLFAGLSRRQLRKLAADAREVRHGAGHVVTIEGRPGLGFHLILEGQVAVTQANSVRRTLGPGDYFGEISMIDGQGRSATVTTMAPMRAVAVSHAAFDRLLDDDPGFARGLLLVLCNRLREAEQRAAATG